MMHGNTNVKLGNGFKFRQGTEFSHLRSTQTERGPQNSMLSNDHRLHFLWNKAPQGITLNFYLI
jgi:hypothetical protein